MTAEQRDQDGDDQSCLAQQIELPAGELRPRAGSVISRDTSGPLLRVGNSDARQCSLYDRVIVELAELVAEADYLRYVADWGSDGWREAICAGLSDADADRLLRQVWRDEDEQERRLALQALAMAAHQEDATEDEKQSHRDWTILFALTNESPGTTPASAWERATVAFENQFGRPASPVPDVVNKAVKQALRGQKQRAVKAAASFERQLGPLREQTPEPQRRTIADWVRNARRSGYVPPLPARPKAERMRRRAGGAVEPLLLPGACASGRFRVGRPRATCQTQPMGLRHIAAITLVGLAGVLASSSEAATPALYKNCTDYASLGVARSAIDHLRPRPAPQRRTLEPSRTMFVAAAVATGAVSIAVSAQAVATATPKQIILKKADLPGWNAGPTGSYSSRDILQQQDHAYPRGPRPLDGYIAAFRTKKMAMNVFVATASSPSAADLVVKHFRERPGGKLTAISLGQGGWYGTDSGLSTTSGIIWSSGTYVLGVSVSQLSPKALLTKAQLVAIGRKMQART